MRIHTRRWTVVVRNLRKRILGWMSFTSLLCLHQPVSEQLGLSENGFPIFWECHRVPSSVHGMCQKNQMQPTTIFSVVPNCMYVVYLSLSLSLSLSICLSIYLSIYLSLPFVPLFHILIKIPTIFHWWPTIFENYLLGVALSQNRAAGDPTELPTLHSPAPGLSFMVKNNGL